MKRRFAIGAVAILLLSGCATTLTHPVTGQQTMCQSGFAIGGGTGAVGLALAALSVALNVGHLYEYRRCVREAATLGYEEPPELAGEGPPRGQDGR